jgi:poly(hydroxyalkanoate) depolymerase family esterase
MYIYVPDKVAANPPILTLIHYCGGSASSVFGQASTVIKVVDENGVIVVAPDNGARCWDVQTTKGLTRDGGGDTHAIKQMVLYAIATYKANADRVYSTGDSSGGMTTQLLLALYPDIFKGGASFAGIPAGCRSGNETGNGYSSACAGGTITHTAQEWGDIVRKMDSGYSGYRPRVQLFHGDQDQYISYKVHAEAIKEWSNILGLDATTPTSTSTVTLGSHQASRQTWKNSCGFVVLDAFLSAGGDHGPSDALFNSYVAPFLGLDKTGAVDPEIDQCGNGGTDGGASGAGGSGGGAGGSSGVSDGGGSAGNTGAGGSVLTGGSPAAGGSSGSGGNNSKGGASGTGVTGGSSGSGGNSSKGSGGSQATGGSATGGSSNGTGGAQASGGSVGTGGKSSTGGSASSGSGGTSSKGGAAGNSTASGSGSSGCSIVFGRPNSNKDLGITMLVLGLALATFVVRRRNKL